MALHPMRRGTDKWITVAMLGIVIWLWTQTIRLWLQDDPFVFATALSATVVTIAEGNLLWIWQAWHRDQRRREELHRPTPKS